MDQAHKKSLYADSALLLTQAIWGFGFIIVKASLYIIHPVVLLGIEFSLSAIILGVYLFIAKKSLFKNFKQGLILGLILWIGYMLHIFGLSMISATNAAFITSLSIVLVPVAGYLFFKKKIGLQSGIAILVAFIGVWVLTGGIHGFGLGDLLTLLTALFVALHILYTDKYANQDINPFVLNFQQLSVVGILSLCAMAIFRFPINIGHASVIWTIIYLCLFADTFAYIAQTISQKYTTPLRVALIFSLEPVFTAVFAWLLHSEAFTLATILGGAFVVVGLIISEVPLLKFLKLGKQRI